MGGGIWAYGLGFPAGNGFRGTSIQLTPADEIDHSKKRKILNSAEARNRSGIPAGSTRSLGSKKRPIEHIIVTYENVPL